MVARVASFIQVTAAVDFWDQQVLHFQAELSS